MSEVELMLGLFPCANVYVPAIFCILIFLWFTLWPWYALSCSFSCIYLLGQISRPCYPPPVGDTIGEIFLLDCVQPTTNNPLQPQDIWMCNHLCHLRRLLCTLAHLLWLYVWRWAFQTWRYDFHYVVGYFGLLIMVTSSHGLVGGFNRKNGLGLYSCPLVQLGG